MKMSGCCDDSNLVDPRNRKELLMRDKPDANDNTLHLSEVGLKMAAEEVSEDSQDDNKRTPQPFTKLFMNNEYICNEDDRSSESSDDDFEILRPENYQPPTTLQDLPLEILDMILMKVVMKMVMDQKLMNSSSDELVKRVSTSLMTTWSEWTCRLTTRWFRIVLQRELRPYVVCPVQTDFSFRLHVEGYVLGMAQLENSIFVLCSEPNKIFVYDDRHPNVIEKEVRIGQVRQPCDLGINVKHRCLYVTDLKEKCVWKYSLVDNTIVRFLSEISDPCTISVTPTGRILLPRNGFRIILTTYAPTGVLIHQAVLPISLQDVLHGVETSSGNFVLSHRQFMRAGPWAVSVVDRTGHLLCVYDPKEESERLMRPCHLALDPYDRVFVADNLNDRVMLLDSELNWKEEILTDRKDGIEKPNRLFYDSKGNRLLVGNVGKKVVDIYSVSQRIIRSLKDSVSSTESCDC